MRYQPSCKRERKFSDKRLSEIKKNKQALIFYVKSGKGRRLIKWVSRQVIKMEGGARMKFSGER